MKKSILNLALDQVEQARSTWIELAAMGRMAAKLPQLQPRGHWSSARMLEERASQSPDAVLLAFAEARYTLRDVDRAVNRYANFFQSNGIRPGDVVGLVMDSRPEFLFAITALNRQRAVAALINATLVGPALAHSLDVAKPKAILVGSECAEALAQALPLASAAPAQVWLQQESAASDTFGFAPINSALAAQSERPPRGVGLPETSDAMCYIYTSGTTGMPKAAVISNQRWLSGSVWMGRSVAEAGPGDVIYCALPLYHTAALCGGWGAALASGAVLALRRKFSAAECSADLRRFNATILLYVGELCRYWLAQAPTPQDREHRLRLALGSGLRADTWERFQARFGVPLIREMYGATEGNAPLVNFEGRPGMLGRLRHGQILVRFDAGTSRPARTAQGRCERVGIGEAGLLLAKITAATKFEGYLDDERATEGKIVRGVIEPGDSYFNTGDVLQLHEGDWVSFVERLGDTYRWKGENVSTTQVAELVERFAGVREVNVYGVQVPGCEGRAGMACIVREDAFHLDDFADHVTSSMPRHQRPLFLRLLQEMKTTATLKYTKVEYQQEGYDPGRVRDPLYYFDGLRYVPLNQKAYEQIQTGELQLG
ncbi:long-chain-acyl-CoA synthetase [Sorangium sp. So ce429]